MQDICNYNFSYHSQLFSQLMEFVCLITDTNEYNTFPQIMLVQFSCYIKYEFSNYYIALMELFYKMINTICKPIKQEDTQKADMC